MPNNPYTLVFGKKPKQNISRTMQLKTIVDMFSEEEPSQLIYIITGVRGSGKTVLMTEVASHFSENNDWVVVSLNPEKDLLEGLVAKLYYRNDLNGIFQKAKINLSFFGLGIDISGSAPITNSEVAVTRLIESLHKHGKRVLITIDEVTNTQQMREFAAAYQIFIRDDLPVFLLMTGLYDNVQKLENVNSLTFLYRAPKIELKPLNIGVIASNYEKILKKDAGDALKMAKMTKGYSFAFQVLGFYTWEHQGDVDEAFPEYKQYLDEYVYDKIWAELSHKDKMILNAMASVDGSRVKSIREILNMDTNEFNPYRKRLIKKGLIDGSEYGNVSFTLPEFDRYVMENYTG